MATTSERLREIISIRGIKQVEIIEKTGINKGALSSYITGRYTPKQDNIYKLAKVLCVNPGWLMGLDVSMEPDEPAAPVSPSVAPVQLTSDESDLLNDYRTLNTEGKSYINRQMDYATKQAEFLKDTMLVTTEMA